MPGGQTEPATPAFRFACPPVGVAQLPRGGYLHAVITTGQRWDPAIATGGRPSQTLIAADT